jgi:uncharacterized membrane protein YtjA (UPF0391 family)
VWYKDFASTEGVRIPAATEELHFILSFVHLNLKVMLRWSVIFFIIAIIAAIFGFGGIAAGAASIAKVLFFIFLALFIITILFGASLFKK